MSTCERLNMVSRSAADPAAFLVMPAEAGIQVRESLDSGWRYPKQSAALGK
jgi:hypothetical protein